MVVRIATRSPKGSPQLVPLWFATHRGRIYMNTGDTSPVVRDIAVHPDVVLLFERASGASGAVLRVRGRATFRRDRRVRTMMGVRVWSRYYLSSAGIVSIARHAGKLPAMVQYYRERGRGAGVIEVIPEKFELLALA